MPQGAGLVSQLATMRSESPNASPAQRFSVSNVVGETAALPSSSRGKFLSSQASGHRARNENFLASETFPVVLSIPLFVLNKLHH